MSDKSQPVTILSLTAASCLFFSGLLSPPAEAGFFVKALNRGHFKEAVKSASSPARPFRQKHSDQADNNYDSLKQTAAQSRAEPAPVGKDPDTDTRGLAPQGENSAQSDTPAEHTLGTHSAQSAAGSSLEKSPPEMPSSPPAQAASQTAEQPPEQTNGAQPAGAENTASSPAAASTQSGPPEYHRAQMRLSGSMCYSCLHDLHEKLKKTNGVEKLKIDRPEQGFYQPYAPDVSSWAQAIIVYDATRLPLDELKSLIHNNGYHAYKIVDKLLEKPLEQLNEEKL